MGKWIKAISKVEAIGVSENSAPKEGGLICPKIQYGKLLGILTFSEKVLTVPLYDRSELLLILTISSSLLYCEFGAYELGFWGKSTSRDTGGSW